MKKLILATIYTLAVVLVTMFLNGKLNGYLHNKFEANYELCKKELIASNNYLTTEQAVSCAYNRTSDIAILATMLGLN